MGFVRVPEATRLQGLAQNLLDNYIFHLSNRDNRGAFIKVY